VALNFPNYSGKKMAGVAVNVLFNTINNIILFLNIFFKYYFLLIKYD